MKGGQDSFVGGLRLQKQIISHIFLQPLTHWRMKRASVSRLHRNYAASDKDLSSILTHILAYPGSHTNSAISLHCHVTRFSTSPPQSPSPHAHSFAMGPAVMNNNASVWCWTSNDRVKRPAQRRAAAAAELEVRRPHRSTIARAICPVPNKSLSLSLSRSLSLSLSLIQPSSLPRTSIPRSFRSLCLSLRVRLESAKT